MRHGARFPVTALSACKPNLERFCSALNFILNAEDAGQKEVWAGDNTRTKVPLGRLFLLETFFKEADRRNGRFQVAITPEGGAREVAFDIHDFTHNTGDPARRHQRLQPDEALHLALRGRFREGPNRRQGAAALLG